MIVLYLYMPWVGTCPSNKKGNEAILCFCRIKMLVKYKLGTFPIALEQGADLASFKRSVFEATGVAESRQKIIAKGRQILDDQSFRALKEGCTVMLLEQPRTGTYGSRISPSTSQSRGQTFQKALLKAKAAVKKAVTPDAVLRKAEIENRVAAAAKLNYLALSGVCLDFIPPGSFDGRLRSVELVNCSWDFNSQVVRSECLAQWFGSSALCTSLKKLVLNYCQLEDRDLVFQAINGLKNLTHLELKGNKLSGLPRLDFPKLKFLDLSKNVLIECGNVELCVDEVNLHGNKIRTLDLSALAGCRVVVASGNDVQAVVTSNSKIEILDVRNNRNLAELPAPFFKGMAKLAQLEMAGTMLVEKKLEELEEYASFAKRNRARKDKQHAFVRDYNLQ
jgi:hypothetical protein